jgi:hypothetical protein
MMIILDKDKKFHYGYCGHKIRCPATADKATLFGREIASLSARPIIVIMEKALLRLMSFAGRKWRRSGLPQLRSA